MTHRSVTSVAIAILAGLATVALSGCPQAKTQATAVLAQSAVLAQYCRLPLAAPPPSAGQAAFSDYAWQLFVALNWPVQAGARGQPNCNVPISGVGPTVWASYKTVDQLFLPGARDPGPWNSPITGVRTLLSVSKAPASLPLQQSIRQAVGGWLIDQQSAPTYYQVAVDETGYDYVRANHYYDAKVVGAAKEVAFPDGAIEIKAAWRILRNADARRYYAAEADVMTYDAHGKPTGRTERATVGLVGLHVVYKAAGFPQWLWATFEQVDVVTPGAGVAATYYNPNCSGAYCTPNVSPVQSGQPFGTPNQVTRLTALRPETVASNTQWRQRLAGTPFQYYQLVSPQWPADPHDPGNPQGTPTPGTVANVTMESYVQATSSCMDCHSTARVPGDRVKSNYSFIFLFAQTP